ncbi:methionyl-tRNA formyltransferase [Kaustia mangrovi]|uniref:Methionyl-tRNA formyltransferase n=1 Tax=Kaustia mangrovi TaxID=2593653 RepID=A0A7S8HCL0_9HYPH|nr:methionyl-tRNA formyltransferase [Kaustia mangrovi]QPC43842.1 methionyl-tRNA formyltransferase [Kaustia mangrovi]
MLRVVFMGTPDFAVPTLGEILGQGHEVAAVYTQPPRKAGRGMSERPSPVHDFANAHGLPVRTPTSLKAQGEQEAFAALGADVAVVVAYGLILPRPILDAPGHGCLNLHASRLPRWRGAAPIQRAIMAGDTETAATVMRMDEGLDTGPVCLAERVPIGPETTAGELHDAMAAIGATLMARALAALSRGALDCVPQPDGGVTYAVKIDKAEARIDFSLPAREVHDRIRGLSPFPGAWFEMETGGARRRVKVLAATLAEGNGAPGEVLDDALTIACGEGAIRLVRLQREGKAAAMAQDFLRGHKVPAGTVLA